MLLSRRPEAEIVPLRTLLSSASRVALSQFVTAAPLHPLPF